MLDRRFSFRWARGVLCGLAALALPTVPAKAASPDPFASGAHSGFSPKNPNFARYAASEARGFDRVGKAVELEFVLAQRPSAQGESWPPEPPAMAQEPTTITPPAR